jgi:ATP-binding cassette subfamily B protein
MAKIVDELAAGRNLNLIVLYVLITLAGNMLLSLITSALVKTRSYHQNQFYKNEQMFLADKLLSMDYCDIENRETRMLFEQIKAESHSGYNMFYLYTFFGRLVASVSNIAASAIFTFSLFSGDGISTYNKLAMVCFCSADNMR